MDDVNSYSYVNDRSWRSANFEGRKGGVSPSIIILHYTGMQNAEAALRRLCDPLVKVSAHYVVDETGQVYGLVDEKMRAWHAGVSYWAGEVDINSNSIGIEIVNPGHEFGYREFPKVQIEAVLRLCQDIQDKHDIKHVLAHSDIAPDRKEDPGELFPWKYLASQGVGVWPNENEIVGGDFVPMLSDIGYNPNLPEKDLLIAFQRHFVPEVFDDDIEGQLNDLTRARLTGLHKLLSS